ncbi:MAG: serine hydrolase [Bacteroidales bacterium]|jgi:hypothetical protein|nr:serine hydrolase [Bacteroidales bacterium]
MKISPEHVVIAIVITWFLTGCNHRVNTETKQADPQNHKHHVSMDGLWRVSPETAKKFPHGTLEFVINISGEASGNTTARGCFLWDDRFFDYWNFDSVRVSGNQVVLVDEEGSRYIGTLDENKEMIQGFAYWVDEESTDTGKMDFIREEVLDVSRLFIPYPPGPGGSIKYTYHQPEFIGDQWQTASIFDYVKDTAAFFRMMDRIIRQDFGRLESFLVIIDRKLILEEYFYGYDRTQKHDIHSCTKSIVSLLLGITLAKNNLRDVDQSIFNYFPEYLSLKNKEKEQITLKQVLTMTSGLDHEDDFEPLDPADQTKQILSLPVVSEPGEAFKYNNNSTNLIGGLIYILENKQADDFAKEVLFNKLGISDFYWEREGGVLHCHNDLHLLPRDMAKIGLLVLDNGTWNGEQIVPGEWIAASTKPYVAESEFFDYGFQWWYRSKRNKSWWDAPVHGSNDEHDMFLALGHGGQFIMIIRDLDMVIVTTSSDYNSDNGMGHRKVPMVIEELVPLFSR